MKSTPIGGSGERKFMMNNVHKIPYYHPELKTMDEVSLVL